jgi:hypothetical protein
LVCPATPPTVVPVVPSGALSLICTKLSLMPVVVASPDAVPEPETYAPVDVVELVPFPGSVSVSLVEPAEVKLLLLLAIVLSKLVTSVPDGSRTGVLLPPKPPKLAAVPDTVDTTNVPVPTDSESVVKPAKSDD